jgi:hypothetical protein
MCLPKDYIANLGDLSVTDKLGSTPVPERCGHLGERRTNADPDGRTTGTIWDRFVAMTRRTRLR